MWDVSPTLGLYWFLSTLADKGLENYFQDNYLVKLRKQHFVQRVVNRSTMKLLTGSCSAFADEQQILPRFDCNSRYSFGNPIARILVSGVGFLLPWCCWYFCGLSF